MSIPLEIVALEHNPTGSTLQTFRVESAAIRPTLVELDGLQVLALDAGMAGGTQGSIALVVVLSAVRAVVQNIEVSRLERRMTLETDKAAAVIAAGETAVGG